MKQERAGATACLFIGTRRLHDPGGREWTNLYTHPVRGRLWPARKKVGVHKNASVVKQKGKRSEEAGTSGKGEAKGGQLGRGLVILQGEGSYML